jgi:hypothetical protein
MNDIGVVDKLIIYNPATKTTSGNVVMGNSSISTVNKTVGGATQVTLTAHAKSGYFAFVKDGKGDAATNNITIVPDGSTNNTTIDGAANLVINTNYGSVSLYHNGTEWSVTTAQTAYFTGITPGTASASHALVTDANNGIAGLGRVTTTDGVASGSARVVGGQVQAAAGIAVHDSSTELASASYTIPANTIKAGTTIKVKGHIISPTTVGTDTLTFKVYLGVTTLAGTALITSAATDVANGNQGCFEFTLFGTATPGATASVLGVGTYTEMAGTAPKSAFLTPTNFATNGALLLECSLKWSTTNANTASVDWMQVEIVD